MVKKYTLGLPDIILGAIRKKPQELALPKDIKNQPIHLTKDQYEIKKILDDMISLEVEKKKAI